MISIVARAARSGCENGVDVSMWPEWLNHLRAQVNAAQRVTEGVAFSRCMVSKEELDAMKRGALQASFQMAITAVMALSNLPYLKEIPAMDIIEKFGDNKNDS